MSTLFALSDVAAENIAVDDGERRVSWGELDARSTAFGHGIEALGARPGDHVAICVSNRAEFVDAVLGAWRAGCAYTPLKTGWTADEVGAVLDDAQTRVVVTDRPGARAAASARHRRGRSRRRRRLRVLAGHAGRLTAAQRPVRLQASLYLRHDRAAEGRGDVRVRHDPVRRRLGRHRALGRGARPVRRRHPPVPVPVVQRRAADVRLRRAGPRRNAAHPAAMGSAGRTRRTRGA